MHHIPKLSESDEENGISYIAKQTFQDEPTINIQYLSDQIPQLIQRFEGHTDPSSIRGPLRRRRVIREAKKRHHFHGYGILPADVILNITKHMKPRDLKNLLRVNKNFADLGESNTVTIHIGMQREQYPEYYELFGTINRQTPDQEYHCMIEKENRQWWEWQDEKMFREFHGFPNQYEPGAFAPGEPGRVELYSALAKDIEKAKMALKRKKISFNTRSEDLTTKALMLFWKMQWNDRCGLEHLCERTATEDHYVHVRHKLFLAEKPEVRARFIQILKPVACRLWQRLEFRDYTKDWSMTHRRLLRYEQHISVDALDIWVRDLAAELTIEVISKTGILRALRLESAQLCDWDTAWINDVNMASG
ncbi:MAG: hypothetical protein LQ343_005305 [Gyalolechia ehrenbergii]|nr:MAG: hypothetical protein LQ343_005305 [Gyalolechia ehrenbergii]